MSDSAIEFLYCDHFIKNTAHKISNSYNNYDEIVELCDNFVLNFLAEFDYMHINESLYSICVAGLIDILLYDGSLFNGIKYIMDYYPFDTNSDYFMNSPFPVGIIKVISHYYENPLSVNIEGVRHLRRKYRAVWELLYYQNMEGVSSND